MRTLIVYILLVFATVGLLAPVANAAGLSKPARLNNTVYCKDEGLLASLGRISHLDERNQIDRIVIQKKTRKLHLLSQGRIYKTYDVAFGFGYADGNKMSRGDGRTPEGLYYVEIKNSQSAFRKALRVSYPNAEDIAFARAHGLSTGSDIMIHGFPSLKKENYQKVSDVHPQINWTHGCVAVNNRQIDEIFSLVQVKTPIEICPR